MVNGRRLLVVAVRSVCMAGAGFLAGVLAVFVSLHSLGAFSASARPITIRPVIDIRTPTWTPIPTRTPTPEPTLTPDELESERDAFRSLLRELYIEASNRHARDLILELQPDFGERPRVTCPDCYRVEWYTLTMGGPNEDPWITMTLELDRHETRWQRRSHGIGSTDSLGGRGADRG